MNILITGASGFIGKNIVANLSNIRDAKNKTRPNLVIDNIYIYKHNDSDKKLRAYCKESQFVIHLAGVNRPLKMEDYESGNVEFTKRLMDALEKCENPPKVLYASSIQALLLGQYSNSIYGASKLKAENLIFEYGEKTQREVYVYRFPNIYGKWCVPDYNSVVATLCYRVANGYPYTIYNKHKRLELLYIDDLLEEVYDCLEGNPHRCNYLGLDLLSASDGKFCYVPKTSFVSLGTIERLLCEYNKQPETLIIHNAIDDSFEKKLYAMFLSYLPCDKFRYSLKMEENATGSFTELMKSIGDFQFSVNITNPRAIRGQHWHNTKWEIFVVVSGKGLIQLRKYGTTEILNYFVSADKLEAVRIPPGYIHNLINVSEEQKLVTLIWANEHFDKNRPDTYREKVE